MLENLVERSPGGQRKLTLEEEAAELNRLLVGRVVKIVWRHRPKEIVIEFTDQTRLFVDWQATELEMSVTNNVDEDNPN
jgi:hypothetical protein